ncbi:MAG: LEA type 2 family protein [Armatimonadetes bacterium]|nr:LEA type 2 family protein [Armatimonadota bacterium]
MRFSRTLVGLAAPALLMAAMLGGCKALKDVTSALTDLKKLQFKLENVSNFTLAGTDISDMSSLSAMQMVTMGAAFAQKKIPVNFTLNVAARNPNDGTSGGRSTPLYLRKLGWTLLIDDRTTISGVVDKRLEIPASGQSTMIPISVGLDLYQFFGDRGLNDMVNLALAIGGAQGSSSRLKLTAKVSVETPIGLVDYPGDITIVDQQFTNP